jgi:hypothetical protein
MVMARTLEQLDKALTALDAEMAANRQRDNNHVHPLRRMAGYFTGDQEWKEIFDEIQRQREQEFREAQETPNGVAV